MNIPTINKEVVDTVTTDEVLETVATDEITDTAQTEPTAEVTNTEDGVNGDQPKHESVEGAFSGSDRIPALWNIAPTEEGIEAFNSTTQNRFVGTIADFNAKLKG